MRWTSGTLISGWRPIVPVLGLLIVGLPVSDIAPAHAGSRDQILPVERTTCRDMQRRRVMRSASPIACRRLRVLRFAYFGFDDRMHDDGQIVVMDAVAEKVRDIFRRLREIKFPIAKAKPIIAYAGDDDKSMTDDNTSAFNDRTIAGVNFTSMHAYGLAIDINPVQNPSLRRSGSRQVFRPPAGARYGNRRHYRAGMAEAVVDIFADNGFVVWGGRWRRPDYQHFQVDRALAARLVASSPTRAQAAFDRYVTRYRDCRRRLSRRRCRAVVGSRP